MRLSFIVMLFPFSKNPTNTALRRGAAHYISGRAANNEVCVLTKTRSCQINVRAPVIVTFFIATLLCTVDENSDQAD